ncbi:MAG: hypothetical protein ACC742_15855 [Thermoanaerobaculales bacterium]
MTQEFIGRNAHLIPRRRRPKLLGPNDVKTTMISTHILGNSGGRGVTSPADTLKQHLARP